jgi:hypothetical protein
MQDTVPGPYKYNLVFDRHDGLKEDAIIADCVSKSKVVSLDGLCSKVAKYFGTCLKIRIELSRKK